MGCVRSVGTVFSPLDEELGLLPVRITPHAHECLVRFGSRMPFEKAAEELAMTLKVEVSEPTARRYTLAAGSAAEARQTQEVERLEREAPIPTAKPEKLFFSADGAMVPLVGGEWAEVKTLTLGEIEAPQLEKEEWVVHSREHSYFSRLCEASEFRRLALVETQRRGVENAKVIAAVTDGAEWEQGLIDFHCPQATRILDFAHAAERIWESGQAAWGEDSPQVGQWAEEQLHRLKHAGPGDVLTELHRLCEQHPDSEVLQENLAYLKKREPHLQYPQFQAQGLPIGSGAMESGNKVVVEARLKGAGMHWARPHINPMLALRNSLCSQRWQENWPQVIAGLHQQANERRAALHRKRQVITSAPVSPAATKEIRPPESPRPTAPTNPPPPPSQTAPESHASPKTARPAPNHPWRRSPIGRAKFWPADHFAKN